MGTKNELSDHPRIVAAMDELHRAAEAFVEVKAINCWDRSPKAFADACNRLGNAAIAFAASIREYAGKQKPR